MIKEHPITTKRKITSIMIAWVLFIGVDFLFHAAILAPLWEEDIPAIKPLDNLAQLIPAGYLSFLLLTTLIGYVYYKIFRTRPNIKDVVVFGLTLGLLYSISNLLGLFSYVAIPLKQLVLFNLVYFIEIMVVVISINHITHTTKLRKSILLSIMIFFLCLISGIVLQNILK